MRLVFLPEAEGGLERIADYIAQDNPVRALSFVRELRDRALQIAKTPHAYPLVPRFESLGIRRCVHGNYLIFFRVQNDEVQVLHILNGAMDVEALLFSSELPTSL
ncbi:type II toxin-antitoxin system RelE/ParE family toxin [Ancylobacter sp. FA202]|uniref:type II toxin-antitoxin system RelE/ParE family toxin n=1 Tax=Ancylobacter sp. FA202 TaxID=1111106 RepID=UPI000379528D|nr:type II toxin-antitoxin system RelE/ParE family toxin [Ancylobacter sp. FA202]